MAAIGVLGAGIIGLTTAATLARRGHTVTIYARDVSPATTSDRAAAIWWPDLAADPAAVSPPYRARVTAWARESWATYRRLMTDPNYGIRPERCHIFYEEPPEPPLAADIVDYSELRHEPDLPGALAWHWVFDSLLIEMPRFMPRLLSDLKELGVRLVTRTLTHLGDEDDLPVELLVNCAGLGNRALSADADLIPIRGQLLYLRPQPVPYKLTTVSNGRSIYWMSRADALVLGGSYEIGEEQDATTEAETEAIWEAHRTWIAAGAGGLPAPELRREDIVAQASGLRPFRRSGVRLELDRTMRIPLVHNYGHGGCGISLAWGCAAEVGDLVADCGG